MSPKSILVVATSHDKLGDSGQSTGCWAEEIMAPILIWQQQGHTVTVASIKGGKIPIDEGSMSDQFRTSEVDEFLKSADLKSMIEESVTVDSITSGTEYDAIYVPGGHGVVWDMYEPSKLHSLLREAYEAGKVISSVCHGPVCLINLKLSSGAHVVQGKQVTGFTNDEEEAVGKTQYVPYLLEDSLKKSGAHFHKTENWKPYAIRDGNLVTGQNPQSSKQVAALVNTALG